LAIRNPPADGLSYCDDHDNFLPITHRNLPAMICIRPFAVAIYLIPCLALTASGLTSLGQETPAAQPAGQAAEEAAEQPDPVGYFLGMSVGQQMAQQGFQATDFTGAGFAAGITDALAGNDASLSDEQMQAVAQKIETILRARQEEMMVEMRKVATANLEKSSLFLEENKKKEGVQTLESGLQYKVIQAGSGESPTAEDTVRVHYTGKLIDGTTFDSSVARGEPAEFGVSQVIPGWRQALQKMKVGGKWMLYIPPQLAYGAQGGPGGGIGPNEALIFEVELLEIVQ
jgi:FKBP-type peptidyl-prolyl cis-trans isomerase FklB